MAYTANDLAVDFKATWTADKIKEQMAYDNPHGLMHAKDLEIQGALSDYKQAMQKQIYNVPMHTTPRFWTSSNISPPLLHERKARQAEMMQRLAAKKRGNKPSYRQRQKNGRKAARR